MAGVRSFKNPRLLSEQQERRFPVPSFIPPGAPSGIQRDETRHLSLDQFSSTILDNIMDNEIPISGGRLNRGRLVRLGNLVLRPADEDVEVERVIIEVGKVFHGVPKTFGRDSNGRLKLEWIEGESADAFEGDDEQSKSLLLSVGTLLRDLHDSTEAAVTKTVSTFRDSLDPSGIQEVVCHGDAGPGNIVLRDGTAFALIDWEMASPGRRSWELATALRYWAPFRNPANKKSAELLLDPWQRAEWILDGYAASDNLRLETVKLLPLNQKVQAEYVIGRIKARGDSVYEEWVAKGGIRRLVLDDAWLGGESERLLQAWGALSNRNN